VSIVVAMIAVSHAMIVLSTIIQYAVSKKYLDRIGKALLKSRIEEN